MRYTPVMGLEIHAELLTNTKVYCSCSNEFGGNNNERICPVCSGFPGTLPVINKDAVTLAVKAGISLDCKINNYSSFDRKNYFYPDLPKAYQITQFEYPICSEGNVKISEKIFRINRIHIEEDAGKLIHSENISMIDFNRCGVPLIEIVTEPDFRTIEDVQAFVEEVALRLKYSGICDARLEQGSLRVDVNISIMPENSEEFGTRAEIKNLNSLKSIRKAIEYEIKRQSELLNNGQIVVQETRRFDESTQTTKSLRSKEEAYDYRYFPEPDIPPIFISDEEINTIRCSLPELPHIRFERYINDYNLPRDDASLIISDKDFSDFYDETVTLIHEYKSVANMMLGELNRCLNKSNIIISNMKFTPTMLAELIKLSKSGKISNNSAKNILAIMFQTGKTAEVIAVENNLIIKDNTDEIINAIDEVICENHDNLLKYKNGKTQLFGYFMGQVIQKTGKGTNPELVKKLLSEKLN